MDVLSSSPEALLGLIAVSGLGSAEQRQWRERIRSWGCNAPQRLSELIRKGVLSLPKEVEHEVDGWCFDQTTTSPGISSGIFLIPLWSNLYPPMLAEIQDAPFFITVWGSVPLLQEVDIARIALVGTRKPSDIGARMAQMLGSDLAQLGVVVVSGLALGIDGIAHTATLNIGKGIAVLGGGVGRVHPVRHEWLARALVENGGAIVSEYLPFQEPRAHQFLLRNRLISALSHIITVVEAPERSGSLNTARWALAQGKEVAVVPDTPFKINARGGLALLRDGAHLVTSAHDLVQLVPNWVPRSKPSSNVKSDRTPVSAKGRQLVELLKRNPRAFWDDTLYELGWDHRTLVQVAQELKDAGWLQSIAGGVLSLGNRSV